MASDIRVVIMCGGSGTRLWPASRPSRPKQFAAFAGDRSLFAQALDRNAIDGAGFVVVAGAAHGPAVSRELAAAGVRAQVILEPEPRDSAPALAAAAAAVHAEDPETVLVIVASDHHVPDVAAYRETLRRAIDVAREGSVVTLGVRPDAPSSAYGYIRPSADRAGPGAYRVAAFVEKPDPATAARYVADGYLWNSGNFVARVDVLIAEFERHAPDVLAAAREALRTAEPAPDGLSLGPAFRSARKTSIDYAVMERTDRAAVLPVAWEWSDLGAWDAVHEASAKDADGNALSGDVVAIGSSGCLVRAAPGMLAAVVGLEDVVVVVENDAVLVCRRDAAGEVKAVARRLAEAGDPRVDVPAAAQPPLPTPS